jgi:hypothetical protein
MDVSTVAWGQKSVPFFVPYFEESPEQQEEIYALMASNVAQQTGASVSPNRISAIRFRHDGVVYIATVGGEGHRESVPGKVLAIFHEPSLRDMYFIASQNRGLRGPHALEVGSNEILDVQLFAPGTKQQRV